ncbi:MAG: ABC transporter ATP-binding protein [Ilumatobacteraceae bacterium]
MSLEVDAHVRRGDFELDVQLSVKPGELLAVLGPNGAGKSTLLRVLAGLAPIDGGHITLDDTVLDAPDEGRFVPPERRPIGVVFQDYLLFDHLDARDNVAFGLRTTGLGRVEARRRAEELLAQVGLAEFARRRPKELSGGQAQRVALARALARQPRALLLDEPLAALDVGTRRRVRRDLRRHLDGFDGVRLLVTHDPLDVYALADRVAIVDGGRVVQSGTVAEITAHPRSRYVADLVGTNLVAGQIGPAGLVAASGAQLAVTADFSGPAFAVVRPQSITLSHHVPETSARNVFVGIVDDVDRLGERARIGIEIADASGGPLHLTAEITVRALDELALRAGDPVVATMKATDIEAYPA